MREITNNQGTRNKQYPNNNNQIDQTWVGFEFGICLLMIVWLLYLVSWNFHSNLAVMI